MFAMWLVGRLIAALPAMVVASTLLGPVATASPEGSPEVQYGQPPVWGSCANFLGSATALPTAQCGTVSVPVDLSLIHI